MSSALQPSAAREGVTFELERLEFERDELVVSGHWSGVRGLRFVRPALIIGDRRVLATLEHKPWAPSSRRPWIAAFPWDGGELEVEAAALDVAPSVRAVPLGSVPGKGSAAAIQPPADATPPAPPRQGKVRRTPAAKAKQELSAVAAERDRLQRALAAVEHERDRALEQCAEAVKDREAAVRTRARMEQSHDEVLEARQALEATLAAAIAQRDEAQSQRDEMLLAYRALQRHMRSELADADRQSGDHDREPGDHDNGRSSKSDEPIGVRTMPAARTVMAELQRQPAPRKFAVSTFDMWVMRVLGSVAAACFILLLVSILGVFL